MATRIIPLKAGQRCRCVFDISPAGSHEKAGAVCIGATHVPMQAVGDELIAPPMPPGLHLFEVRVDGVSVAYGYFEVAPSPLAAAGGEVTAIFTGDLSAPVARFSIELNQGPRGDSTYDIAVREGFEGTEAEWLESLRAQAAELAVELVAEPMERAEKAREAAEQARQEAQAAQRMAEQEASKAERHAELLGDAALQSGDNSFAGNNDHAGTEIFNGAVALNGGVLVGGRELKPGEGTAAYYFVKQWVASLTTLPKGFFSEVDLGNFPTSADGMVVLNFPNVTSATRSFVKGANCRSRSLRLVMPKVKKFDCCDDFNRIDSSWPQEKGCGVYVEVAEATELYFRHPYSIWCRFLHVTAPKALKYDGCVRQHEVRGSLPLVEVVDVWNEYYTVTDTAGYRWLVPLPSLKEGGWGKNGGGYNKVQLSAESVFCILGTVPVWADGEAHALHLNILPSLQNDADFQERLAAALGSQNDDGSYKGALVRVYEENGSSGEDELGRYTDEYVADKGWQITISYI